MHVAHLLRKYNPAEWGGTETAVQRLCDGLRAHEVRSTAFCPQLKSPTAHDPLAQSGHEVKRFKSCVPVWGISRKQKDALVAMGGNLISFDLLWSLCRAPKISLIHAHTQNRIGGIGLTIARLRKIPFVASIHGGVLDLPALAKAHLIEPLQGGFEWGKIFGAALRSRRVLEQADAIVTCNKTEAGLLREKFPWQRVIVQPHGIPASEYERDCREQARAAFPQIVGKKILLMVGRIDTVKNQRWVVEQAPAIFQKFPNAILIVAGSCTDAAYGETLRETIQRNGLSERIFLTGGLPPGDARLIGLFQDATVLILPSISEPFGLVILESWAAGTPVISSRTSGARDLIRERENGWLFDLEKPACFHAAVAEALSNPNLTKCLGRAGQELVQAKFDSKILAGEVKKIYERLIEEKQ